MTAAERHANYMTKNSDKTAVITIQGKVIHSVAYPSSVNCNIAIQEGKYGYFMNNVPQSSIEIGKSYIFTGKGAGKEYPALNMTGGTVTPLETPVVADPLIIGSDVSFEDSRNALFNLPEGGVTVTEVVKTGETTTGLKFKIGENDYLISYNAKVISAASIATKLGTAGVGTKITNLKAAWFYDNSTDYPYETYQICDAADITLEAATPASVAVTAANDATEVQMGTTLQLSAAITPSGASQDVTWKSLDETKATVDATGLVTPVSEGTVTIEATAAGTTVKGTIALTVTAAPSSPVTSITVTAAESATGAKIGETLQLSAAVAPENAAKTVIWTSNKEEVATVDSATGLVTFVGDGAVTITATATDTSGVIGTIDLNTVVADLKNCTDLFTAVTADATKTYSFRGVIAAKQGDTYLVNDSTGGLELYNATGYEGMKVGDTVLIAGTFKIYKGLLENNSVTISKSYVEVTGHPTSATIKTGAEIETITTTEANPTGQYVKLENAKVVGTNLIVPGTTTAVINIKAVEGFKLPDEGIYGTVTAWIEKVSSKYLTIWADSFTANAAADPTTIVVAGASDATTVEMNKTLQMKATATSATEYANVNNAVTWSVANKTGTGDALATIDASTGLLTAGATAGVVTVTATSTVATSVVGTLDVTIIEAVAKTSVTFDFTGNISEFPTSGSTTDSVVTFDSIDYTVNNTYKGSTNSYLMMKNGGYMFNTTALPGVITSIDIIGTSGSSGTAKYFFTFGTTEVSGSQITGTAAHIGQGDYSVTNTVEEAKFFNISTSVKNGQFAKIVINYAA